MILGAAGTRYSEDHYSDTQLPVYTRYTTRVPLFQRQLCRHLIT